MQGKKGLNRMSSTTFPVCNHIFEESGIDLCAFSNKVVLIGIDSCALQKAFLSILGEYFPRFPPHFPLRFLHNRSKVLIQGTALLLFPHSFHEFRVAQTYITTKILILRYII